MFPLTDQTGEKVHNRFWLLERASPSPCHWCRDRWKPFCVKLTWWKGWKCSTIESHDKVSHQISTNESHDKVSHQISHDPCIHGFSQPIHYLWRAIHARGWHCGLTPFWVGGVNGMFYNISNSNAGINFEYRQIAIKWKVWGETAAEDLPSVVLASLSPSTALLSLSALERLWFSSHHRGVTQHSYIL